MAILMNTDLQPNLKIVLNVTTNAIHAKFSLPVVSLALRTASETLVTVPANKDTLMTLQSNVSSVINFARNVCLIKHIVPIATIGSIEYYLMQIVYVISVIMKTRQGLPVYNVIPIASLVQ